MDEIKVFRFADMEGAEDDLEISRMEDIWDRSGGKAGDAHRHNFYTVLWARKASGIHVIDFNRYQLGPEQLYFVSPGQIHQVLATERPEGWAITFSPDFLATNSISESFLVNIHLFNPYGDNPPLVIGPPTGDKLEGFLREMASLKRIGHPLRREALGAYLKLFLIECNQACDTPLTFEEDKSAKHHLLREFKLSVEKDFRKQHKVGPYAQSLSVSPKHLSSLIKTLTGKTSKEYIQERITLEAKRLLLHTELSVKEIAYDLGFEEPLHFSGFFKNCTGISPSKFRSSQA